MTDAPRPGIAANAQVDVDNALISLSFDETLYSLDAAYGASYVFIERCYVLLDRPSEGEIRVTLTLKDRSGANEELLTAHAGEFANELLSCAWRERINEQNRLAIEATTMQAISGAAGQPSLDELEELDFSEEPFDDPLGIAMSWEDKYTKDKSAKKDAPDEPSADGADAAAALTTESESA